MCHMPYIYISNLEAYMCHMPYIYISNLEAYIMCCIVEISVSYALYIDQRGFDGGTARCTT